MTIELDSSDFEVMAQKVASIIKSSGTNDMFIDAKVERYGIPFKVSVSRESQSYYVIDDVSYYGVNTNNIYVSYNNRTMELFGRFHI